MDSIKNLLERLTGERASAAAALPQTGDLFGRGPEALGYSQLNELLLLCGFDRVSQAFFAYLLNGGTEYEAGSGFETIGELEAGIVQFRKLALTVFGNVKFAFKILSTDTDLLEENLAEREPIPPQEFQARHDPILPLEPIAPEDAYLTGYLIERELSQRLLNDPTDAEATALESRRGEVVQQALRNQQAYLASDHLDVYVATSMRQRHEFMAIGRLVTKIFTHEAVAPLKLRWFDPTQAYCANRIDKGLAEALMLKRAQCTIYLAQETDTLGKDSELASTLAQGKPVIAYVPQVNDSYVEEYLEGVRASNPEAEESTMLLDQLRLYAPEAAWQDAEVRAWSEDPSRIDLEALRERVEAEIRARYDKRASTLRDAHPLGIQVNLGTGVANGVLVVRTAEKCAQLVRAIVTRTLEFDLEEKPEYTVLREQISGSIFRVMTADAMLTNAFWNFYLNPAE